MGVLLAALVAILASLATRITPHVREAAVQALNDRFDSETELATLQVSIFPQPEIRAPAWWCGTRADATCRR